MSNDNLEIWKQVSHPPKERLKKIGGGRLLNKNENGNKCVFTPETQSKRADGRSRGSQGIS